MATGMYQSPVLRMFMLLFPTRYCASMLPHGRSPPTSRATPPLVLHAVHIKQSGEQAAGYIIVKNQTFITINTNFLYAMV